MARRSLSQYHLCQGLFAAIGESGGDDDTARRRHAEAKLRLLGMSDTELRELAALTASLRDKPADDVYREIKHSIKRHKNTASEWLNDLIIDWDPARGDKMPTRIMLIGGKSRMVKALASMLVRNGFAIATLKDCPQAILKDHDFKPDLIIIAQVLPSKLGRKVCLNLSGAINAPVYLLDDLCNGNPADSELAAAIKPLLIPMFKRFQKVRA